MRFVIEGSHFKRILGLVKGCVPNKSTLPILQHVLLKAEGGTLTVVATNLDREAMARAPAQIDQGGVIAVPGKILCDFSQRLSPGTQVGFELNAKNGRVTVTSGAGTYVFKAMTEDFPTIGQLQSEAVEFEIEANGVVKLLAVNYAAASDNRRPTFYGVRLQPMGKALEAMGFDENRMSYRTCDLPVGADALKPVTIPYDVVAEVCRVLGEADKVVLSCGSLFQIHAENFSFTTKIMGSQLFPDDKCHDALNMIMREAKPIGKIHPTVFKDVLKRAGVVYASGLAKYEPAVVEFTESGATLSMGEGDGDTAREEMDAEVFIPGKKFRVNRQYLDDILDIWPENVDVTVCMLEEAGRPILFRNEKEPGFLQFAAPMLGAARTQTQQAA